VASPELRAERRLEQMKEQGLPLPEEGKEGLAFETNVRYVRIFLMKLSFARSLLAIILT